MTRARPFDRIGVVSMLSAAVIALAPTSGYADDAASGAAARSASEPSGSAGGEAAIHFRRGLQLFDDGDYTLALVEFERAYQLAPNYRALFNIALVDVQLGRYANAARTFERYLRDGGDAVPAARRAEVNKTLSELKLRTATVEITVNVVKAEVSLDGKVLDSTRLREPLLIDAGEHVIRATAPGHTPSERTVTLAGGDQASVSLELASLTPSSPAAVPVAVAPTPASPHLFWPGLAVTGGLAAGALVSGVIMLDARSHLSDLKDMPGSSSADRESAASRANSAALTGDVLGGLALLAGGVSLYLSLTPSRPANAPNLAVGPHRIVVSGTF